MALGGLLRRATRLDLAKSAGNHLVSVFSVIEWPIPTKSGLIPAFDVIDRSVFVETDWFSVGIGQFVW